MRRFFRNIPWKNILIISLALVLGAGAIAGITSIVKEEKTTINATAFKRGALNDLGFYIESDQSIYTKDLIECQGLEIEPDFEVIGNYRVYYYDANKNYLGATKLFSAQEDGVYVKGEEFPYAKYCRIVITPTPEKDEDGHVEEDFKINFYEVAGYANKYKIRANKDQTKVTISQNLFIASEEYKGFLFDAETLGIADHDEYSMSEWIDTQGASRVKIVCPANIASSRTNNRVFFGNDDVPFLCVTYDFYTDYKLVDGHYEIIVDIPSNSDSIIISYLNDYPLEVYLIG